MRHQRKGKTLDRNSTARKALLRNLATSLILHEHVNTTLAKAKAVKPVVEKLITTGKQKTLTSRRKLASYITIESAVNKVLEELGPRYAERKGGYLRIIKLGQRQGDGACLLYTSDAADDLLCVDLGGRRIIKKKKSSAIHKMDIRDNTDSTH